MHFWVGRFPVNQDLARCEFDQAGQQIQEGRFAAACRSYNAYKLRLCDLDAAIFQHFQIAEIFVQMDYLNLVSHFTHTRSSLQCHIRIG